MLVQRTSKIIIAFVTVLVLTGCAARGTISPLVDGVPAIVSQARVQNIFVASSRKFDSDPSVYLSSDRAHALNFADLAVSVPKTRPEGEIQWASGSADPRRQFAVVGSQKIADDQAFLARLNQALDAKPQRDKAVFIFIHGFNNNFAESLFRLAQLKNDAGINAVTIGYSWPSAGKGSRYAYDRDSVAFARDQLERLFDLAARSRSKRIYVMAHSLGSWLTMESLRQARIGHKNRFFGKLSAVALASPDIDVDVFKTQINRIQPLPRPFFVMTSKQDRALAFLRFFTGDTERVGRIEDFSVLKQYGIIVTDLTEFESSDPLHHSTFATSPEFLELFRQWVRAASGKTTVAAN